MTTTARDNPRPVEPLFALYAPADFQRGATCIGADARWPLALPFAGLSFS
jgi:hypothetical protein